MMVTLFVERIFKHYFVFFLNFIIKGLHPFSITDNTKWEGGLLLVTTPSKIPQKVDLVPNTRNLH